MPKILQKLTVSGQFSLSQRRKFDTKREQIDLAAQSFWFSCLESLAVPKIHIYSTRTPLAAHMTPSSLLSRPALVACISLGALFVSTAADARPFGKKSGWSKRQGSTLKEKKPARRGLFSRAATPKPAAAPVNPTVRSRPTVAQRRPIPAARIAQPVLRPVVTRTRQATIRTEVTSAAPQRQRVGLLAKIFGGGGRSQAAARASAHTAFRTIESRPAPSLAPGQPNANQTAPKIDHALIARSSKSQSRVVINIARQRAYLYIGGQVAVDTPVSTARTGKYTPRGTFRVGERVHSGKVSTIYDVEMPRWMRLGGSAFGMHAGYLPGYPASAGCIRMPYSAADAMYKASGYGTRVTITSG